MKIEGPAVAGACSNASTFYSNGGLRPFIATGKGQPGPRANDWS